MEASRNNSLFNTIAIGIELLPFVAVLIWQKSTAARLALFIVSIVMLAITVIYNLIAMFLMLAVANVVESSDEGGAEVVAAALKAGVMFWAIFIVVYIAIQALIIWLYWKFYTNLRDRK